MGALPRLKLKTELNYRKGSTNESENCKYCSQFIKDYTIPGNPPITESRCWVMGAEPGSRYRVRSDYRCDAQQFNGTDFSKGRPL
ncbi:MAG: hypothetical protein A4E69_01943 [Syntrophus sp. PtaB.Bin138]|nr:MAG: hypothetical protein A4E69_01943 [Syntrophus sp. PtaB.Bin138]